MTARTILIVDDDTELREALVEQLSLYDEFETLQADTATSGIGMAKEEHIDLLLMDVGLPDIDGREAVKLLRKNGFKAPIIMLTGHDGDSDTILGLEAGANDYVTKPFKFAVLLARVRAHLRQHEQSEDATFAIGRYSFRPAAKVMQEDNGSKVRLTEKETSILKFLYRAGEKAGHEGCAFARSVGLQLWCHDPHSGNTYLPVASEDRAGPVQCRASGD
jgi:DNA-binding response OmpR family regulator